MTTVHDVSFDDQCYALLAIIACSNESSNELTFLFLPLLTIVLFVLSNNFPLRWTTKAGSSAESLLHIAIVYHVRCIPAAVSGCHHGRRQRGQVRQFPLLACDIFFILTIEVVKMLLF